MKKFLAFALSATMLLGLTACGGDKEKEPENSVEVGEEITSIPEETTTTETATPAPTPTATQTPSYRLQGVYGFKGGYALIRFYDEANRVYCAGVIDEKGKLQHYVADNGVDDYRSTKGYMLFSKDQTLHMVTPKGKVVTHKLGDNLSVALAMDGYVIIQEYKSGFDAVEYVYHIYDDAGKEMATYSSGSQRLYGNNIRYVGEKTFLFLTGERDDELKTYGYSSCYGDIYFGETDTWMKRQVITDTDNAFRDYTYQDGLFLFRGASRNGSSNTHPGEFAYTDSKGSVKTFTVPEEVGERPYCLGHSKGLMVFRGTKDNKQVLFCYDMGADSWTAYQGQYLDKMVNRDPVVGDGYAAIALRGADGETYTMVLDKKAGEVWDAPLLGTPTAVRDGKVLVMDGSTVTIYDLKGKELGKIERYDTYTNQTSDGPVVGGQYQYFTLEGKEAFTVNFDSGKEVKLPTE